MKIKETKIKTIKDRLEKACAICGNKIKVIRYTDSTYRGGHYFFKTPIRAKKGKTKYAEYWECPKCYWNR